MSGFKRLAEQYLLEWKTRTNRKPLIIRGARQVGKTFLVKQFASSKYKNLIYVNLDDISTQSLFKNIYSIENFADVVRLNFNNDIYQEGTLIFLDEIQNAPVLIKLLRAFYEERPEIHIISAGSLLEVQIAKAGFEFPVGRVEYLYLYPLNFLEFLLAKGDGELYNFILNVKQGDSIDPSIHEILTNKFFEYTKVGGMPEAIANYIVNPDLSNIERVYASLLTSYSEDVYKYTNDSEAEYTQFVLNNSPVSAGGLITYSNYMNSGFGSRQISSAFSVLEKAMVLKEVKATSSTTIPLLSKPKRPRKLLFLDFGFISYKANLLNEIVSKNDLSSIYKGQFAEQIVGQNLIARSYYKEVELNYWAREKPSGSAELDFIIVLGDKIVGIEVKSGEGSKLKSLLSFAKLVNNPILVRVYSGELSYDDFWVEDRKCKLHSIPFYLIDRIYDLVIN